MSERMRFPLRRLDTLLAAVLFAAGLRAVPLRMICAETTCSSVGGAALAITFEVVAACVIAILLWRATSRWWTRSLVMLAALYVSVQGPAWFSRAGRWTISGAEGRVCQVAYGSAASSVLDACGPPAYTCEGPKHFQPRGGWNPAAIDVCSFAGMVYADRIVIMGCGGGVDSVEAVRPGPPEQVRPVGCVTWRRPDGVLR